MMSFVMCPAIMPAAGAQGEARNGPRNGSGLCGRPSFGKAAASAAP
jgi:hypothetical protein